MSWHKHDIDNGIRLMNAAIEASPDLDTRVTVEMSGRLARLFIDFLHDLDPDMPPRPIMKILGPLVGDHMMNEKLNRLDRIAEDLGPTVIKLGMIVDHLERRTK